MSRVLVIGDTHCPAMRRGYVRFLQRVANRYGVNRVVHIGDLLDWAALSRHVRPVELQNAHSELIAARRQIARLARAFPNVDWLTGNHDARLARRASDAGLPEVALRELGELCGVSWRCYPRFYKLEIDGVYYSHGENGAGGTGCALKQAVSNFRSTVIGHYHTAAGVEWSANKDHRIFGLSVGCGIDSSRLEFNYGQRLTKRPLLGCGVVLNGQRAFFEPWLLPNK